MSFLDNVKDFYESPGDSLGKDFIHPALKECVLYRRETAWFKSSALRVWASSLTNILQNKNCKIEIIAYPQIDASTFRALKDSLSEEKTRHNIQNYIEEKILLRALEADSIADEHNRETGKKFGELLSYLINSGKLEIKFAQMIRNKEVIPSIVPDDFEGELTHNKRGYFQFEDETIISFTGSANESLGGLMKQGENFEVYDSRVENKRAMSTKERVDLTWDQNKPGYLVEPVSKKLLERIKKFAPTKPPVFTPSPTPAPTTAPEEEVKTPDGIWEHKKLAIAEFLKCQKGILSMATGTGKTSTALEIARQLILTGKINKIIVSAGTGTTLSMQWIDEIYAWLKKSNLIDSTYVFKHFSGAKDSYDFIRANPSKHSIIVASRRSEVLESLLKKSDPATTLIIQDEVHGFGAKGMLALKGLHQKFKYTLGLSATPSRGYDEIGTNFILEEIGPIIYEYALEDAIRDKILCPFNYFPIKTELSSEDKRKQQKVRGAYELSQTSTAPWPEERLFMELAQIKNMAENKPYDFGKFLDKNPGLLSNSIIFCAQWSQADLICEEVIKHTTSFKRFNEQPSKEEQAAVLGELGTSLDTIITCHSLSEGIDIKSLQNIFLIASYSSQLETIQRIGRCIRIDPNNKSKVANVIDLIVYRNLDSGDIIEADEERMSWIKNISEVRQDG